MVENGGPLSLLLACLPSLNPAIIGAPLGSRTHKHTDPHTHTHTPLTLPFCPSPQNEPVIDEVTSWEVISQWQEKKWRDWIEAFTLKDKWIALTPILIVLGHISTISERSANNQRTHCTHCKLMLCTDFAFILGLIVHLMISWWSVSNRKHFFHWSGKSTGLQ